MTRTIEVDHVGAVEYLRIPIPEGGGVTVIEGANGKGKSETLDAVDKLTGRNAQVPTPSDGYDRGSVKGLGITLSLGKSTRRTGELEVIGLDSRLSVADLVDPGIKDPVAADEKRIKAALSILQVRPRLEDWLPIADGNETLAQAVRDEFDRADDVLILAARLKSVMAAQAKRSESDRDRDEAALAALEGDPAVKERKDPEPPKSHETLSAEFQAAVTARAAIEKQAEKAASAEAWRAELETMRANVADTANLAAALGQFDKTLAKLRDQLAEVERNRADAQSKYSAACQAAEQIKALETKLADATPPEPDALANATAAIDAARDAFAKAEATRATIKAREQAAKLRTCLPGLREAANAARKAAEQPEAILAQLLASRQAGIFIQDGRIRVPHKRGKILYADLSTGERWAIAMRILVQGIGRGGLTTVPQEAWESLDPTNKKMVAALAVENGVNILTAACSDDQEIKASVYEGN